MISVKAYQKKLLMIVSAGRQGNNEVSCVQFITYAANIITHYILTQLQPWVWLWNYYNQIKYEYV